MLFTIIQGAVDFPDPIAQKTCFIILSRLVELWGTCVEQLLDLESELGLIRDFSCDSQVEKMVWWDSQTSSISTSSQHASWPLSNIPLTFQMLRLFW